MDTHSGNKQARYWEAGVRKAETRGERGRQRQNMGNFGPSLHRSTLEALEKNTGQNYIPRDPKTVGWGEKERRKKDDHHRKEYETDRLPDRKNRQKMWRTPQHKSLQRRQGQAQPG